MLSSRLDSRQISKEQRLLPNLHLGSLQLTLKPVQCDSLELSEEISGQEKASQADLLAEASGGEGRKFDHGCDGGPVGVLLPLFPVELEDQSSHPELVAYIEESVPRATV